MVDLRADENEEEFVYEFEYSFSSDGEERRVGFVTDTTDKTITDELARRELADEVGSCVDEWTIRRVKVGFANPPWDSLEELKTKLANLEEVSHARLVDKRRVASPTEIVLRPTDGHDRATVEGAVKDVFAPLSVRGSGRRVVVNASTGLKHS